MSIYREKIVRYRETMRLELKPWDLVDLYHQINNLFDVLGITFSVIVIGKFLFNETAWRNYVKMKRFLISGYEFARWKTQVSPSLEALADLTPMRYYCVVFQMQENQLFVQCVCSNIHHHSVWRKPTTSNLLMAKSRVAIK